MRIRVKATLASLAVVGLYLLVLLNPQHFYVNHFMSLIQLLPDASFKASREQALKQPLSFSKVRVPLHPTRKNEGNASGDGPAAKRLQGGVSALGNGGSTGSLSSVSEVFNISRLGEPGRKAVVSLRETLRLQKQIENAATPSNFVDVLKAGVTARMKIPSNAGMDSFSMQNSESQYTPSQLRERALTFSVNSSLGRFLSQQRRRLEHVRRECAFALLDSPHKGHPPDYERTPQALAAYPNLILDRQDYLTYCPVYKAASTSWSIILLQMRGLFRKRATTPLLQGLLSQVFPRPSAIAGPMLTKKTTKFMVVRHPLERLVSCYRDKFEGANKIYYYEKYGHRMVCMFRPKPQGFSSREIQMMQKTVMNDIEKNRHLQLRGNPYATPVGPTFAEFVQYILASPEEDEHWRPYYKHCATCFIDYDVVLRFERLYDDSLNFIEYLNRTAELKPRWDNPSDRGESTSQVTCSYFAQLTVELVAGLLEKYAYDFKLFEYSSDEYLKCASDYKAGVAENVMAGILENKRSSLVGQPFR